MDRQRLDKRDMEDLYRAFQQADHVVMKKYLHNLSSCPICALPPELSAEPEGENFQVFQVEKIVYDKDENSLEKFSTVFNTLSSMENSALVTILVSDGDAVCLYCGSVYHGTKEPSELYTRYKILHDTMKANFPGIELADIKVVSNKQYSNQTLLSDIFDNIDAISCVSGVAMLRREQVVKNEEFVQGMEKLIDTMRGKRYSAIFLAECRGNGEIEKICADYEDIYSAISPFLQSQHTVGTSDSETKSIIEGITNTTNQSTAKSISHSNSSGKFISNSLEGSISTDIKIPIINIGANVGASYNRTKGTDTGTSDTSGTTDTSGTAESLTKQNSVANALSNSETLQLTFQNRAVKTLMERIDEQIKRLRSCEDFGIYSFGAYFIAGDRSTTVEAASSYQALMRGEHSSVEASAVNTWYGKDAHNMAAFLRRMAHPQVAIPDQTQADYYLPITPASFISGKELSLHMCFPKKSVPGVPVLECAEFGREVVTYDNCVPDHALHLGRVFHMHKAENSSIMLDRDSLASHTFVTGSTGSGKSNTIYQLLDKLSQKNVKFLVVEPAKGEYKDVFGNRKDVSVFGTNPKKAPLLQINPFSFPDDVHVLEHIDRLVELFNACWPMYAAMPAILKDAVEQAYRKCGWNLSSSTCSSLQFPTFVDILKELPDVVEKSNYSSDTSSDYKGALITRVRSLTNGIYGQILCSERELSSKKLFDGNVIVDLSRVGSSETKALLMGILVMKLQEYRMSTGGINARLKHVTVLEEAHNLLRRTSSEQSQDSSNLQGKSVEMLANAIAEMRTYGEGFIIADQSPGLLDLSVIRNTNTKIIMRLPDLSDRELVGRAASLNDGQIEELAKLPRGVAAVYQNDWLQPVLCQMERFQSPEQCYQYTPPAEQGTSPLHTKFLRLLVDGVRERKEFSPEEADRLKNWIDRFDTGRDVKEQMLQLLKPGTQLSEKERGYILYCLVKGKTLIELTQQSVSPEKVQGNVEQQIMEQVQASEEVAKEIRRMIFEYAASCVEHDRTYAEDLRRYGGIR